MVLQQADKKDENTDIRHEKNDTGWLMLRCLYHSRKAGITLILARQSWIGTLRNRYLVLMDTVDGRNPAPPGM